MGGIIGIRSLNAAVLGPVINAGIAGGVSGLIASGGSLKGAALGVLQAGLFDVAGDALAKAGSSGFFGIGSTASAFIAHGLVGGLVSEIGQGRFGSGFLAGGISSFTPVPVGGQLWEKTVEGTFESAALGGVGSVLGGGKFENGAETGAFAYMFNCLAHECLEHYIEGSGKSLNANISELGINNLDPTEFPKYDKLISDPDLQDGTYSVFNKIVISADSSLNSEAAYGHVVLDLAGTLSVSGGKYVFYGQITAEPDRYDFDPRPWGQRTFWGEVSTRVGNLLPGKAFVNIFQGNVSILKYGIVGH